MYSGSHSQLLGLDILGARGMIQTSLNSREKLSLPSVALGPELCVSCKRPSGFLALSSCTCKSRWHSGSSFLLQKPLASVSSTKPARDHTPGVVLLLFLLLLTPFGIKTLLLWSRGRLGFASSLTVGLPNVGTSPCLNLGFVPVQSWGEGGAVPGHGN